MRSWDHPRACGKNGGTEKRFQLDAGSPPRMREESVWSILVCGPFGITPAHAGRIYNQISSTNPDKDHPRACGKNLASCPDVVFIVGSPPRMREEFIPLKHAPHDLRITPAHAGRITKRNDILQDKRDHPRACGKNSVLFVFL